MSTDNEPIGIRVHAVSISDALGYRGQKAVAQAVGAGPDYRIVGGHMVRLLLHVYPTPGAILRSTTDADTALGALDVVGPFSENLMSQDFIKEGGNSFYRELTEGYRIEVNVLLSREGPASGLRPTVVPGVGQVDSLPELRFVLMSPALVLDVVADLGEGEWIEYRTQIPGMEAATVLKAHSWRERRSEKDLADLYSLLEIREAHPDMPWRLGESGQIGFRKDTATILKDLGSRIVHKNVAFSVPSYLDRLRFAALIAKHIA